MIQHVVTIQQDGRMDVVGPFRSSRMADRYAERERVGRPRAFIQARPLLRLSPEDRRDLARKDWNG